MGKKRSRKSYSSKGLHSNVATSTLKLAAKGVSAFDKAMNKVIAWRAGKNPWITLPDNKNSGQRHIKVRANDCYGNPKTASANLFRGG